MNRGNSPLLVHRLLARFVTLGFSGLILIALGFVLFRCSRLTLNILGFVLLRLCGLILIFLGWGLPSVLLTP
jgi:hypothetical protein